LSSVSARPEFFALVSADEIREKGEEWHRDILQDIELRLDKESTFPCVFAKNACQKDLLKFVFVDRLDDQGLASLAVGLAQYVDLSRNWDGSIDTAYPLIVGFSKQVIGAEGIEDYHAFGWDVLQQLHHVDPGPWPAEVAADPSSPDWSMCFNGMPLFVNMSNPAHRIRQSRNLGQHLVFVVNPRERFDVFAGDTPGGRKVRANIRKRILRHDGAPHSPQLGSYGVGGVEWWQYGLIDKNEVRTDECPFRFADSKR
jgi:FPC/CPF motif-containing protein YcgG